MQLRLEKVCFTYAPGTAFEKQALDNIGLNIEKGEFIALIGHTGSGKSTLINLLNALEKPTSGRVLFEGEDINAEEYDRKLLRSKVGLVFQYPDHQLFEETIYKEIAYGPKNLGLTDEEIEKRVIKSAELTGIKKVQFTDSPLELSGGQKKRVTIASVLAMEPEVLILDEPAAGLDPAGRDEILRSIRHIHEQTGCTVIFVSHSMEEAAEFAERIIVLYKGQVRFDDAKAKVFAHYKELEEIGLAAPEISYLMHRLREEGFKINPNCITVSEAEEELRKYLRNNVGGGAC